MLRSRSRLVVVIRPDYERLTSALFVLCKLFVLVSFRSNNYVDSDSSWPKWHLIRNSYCSTKERSQIKESKPLWKLVQFHFSRRRHLIQENITLQWTRTMHSVVKLFIVVLCSCAASGAPASTKSGKNNVFLCCCMLQLRNNFES